MKNISLIIGSGFSYPRKIPGVNELGKRIIDVKADNIYYHTKQTIQLVDTGGKERSMANSVYVEFYEELIKFYLSETLQDDSLFNYEDFFDYYYSFFQNCNYSREFKIFITGFNNKRGTNHDAHNLLLQFHFIFSQLIAKFLYISEFHDMHNTDNFLIYASFGGMIKRFMERGVVNIHTLNHDLLLEDVLNKSPSIEGNFSDGFSELKSQYYGETYIRVAHCNGKSITRHHTIRLKSYRNDYSEPLRLYKLHGSVDNIIRRGEKEVRVKQIPDVWKYLYEKKDDESLNYTELHDNPFPEYLTGRNSKEKFYEQDYFKKLFSHFRENIRSSELLVFIGYGFGDKMFEKMISEEFDFKVTPVVIIDIKEEADIRAILPFQISNLLYRKKGIDCIDESDVNEILRLVD